MNDNEILATLTDVMREAFRAPTLEYDEEQELRSIFGTDSVQFVTLILTLEEKFSTMFPESEVDQLTTVGSLFELVRRTLPQHAGAAS